MKGIHKKLQKLSKGRKSNWAKDAEFRIRNRKWLKYSSNIARRVLAAIEDKKEDGVFNQVILASQVGVTPQYISKVVKGHENLSLETIAKLSDALNIELISFPEYKYSSVFNQTSESVTSFAQIKSDNILTGKTEDWLNKLIGTINTHNEPPISNRDTQPSQTQSDSLKAA